MNHYPYRHYNYNSERIIPFAAPFLFGALTGGVAVAAFNPYRPRPTYNNFYSYSGPVYPYY